MSGVQIHTQDPINPVEAAGVTPQSSYTPKSRTSQQPSTTTTVSNGYVPAQPRATVPTPTSTIAPNATYSAASPQPGAAPIAQMPATTAKATLPPPPKAGEKPMPPEFYASAQATHAQPPQPQPYPSQMSQALHGQIFNGVPPGSTTSTTTTPSYPSYAPPTTLSSSDAPAGRSSLEHPPGYIQNPYASDMTSTQRLVAEQKKHETDSLSPSLGYNDAARNASNAGFGDDQSVWEMAKNGLKKTGEEASKLHSKIWDSLGDK